MSNKILSIIVPTYNMEKYLSYCLDSFLIDKNRDKLEIVIVNDGSCDGSLEIAEKYVLLDSDVFKLIDKRNGNYGSCINVALTVATGKYVKVVDADDSVDTFNLDDFISFLCSHDADLFLSDFVLVDENRKEIRRISYDFGHYEVVPIQQICTTNSFMDMEMHAVTYRRKMLLENGYYQTEGVSYTDQQWIFSPMAYVKNVGVFRKTVYRYLVGRSGQTIDPVVKIKKMPERIKMVQDMIIQYRKLCLNISSDIKCYLYSRILPNIKDIYITYFANSTKISKDEIVKFDKTFKHCDKGLYMDISRLNLHIRIWHSIMKFTLLEYVFCRTFSFFLFIKLRLRNQQ